MTAKEVREIVGPVDIGILTWDIIADAINTFLEDHFKTADYNKVCKALKKKPLKSYITDNYFTDIEDIVKQLSKQTITAANKKIPVTTSAMKSAEYTEERIKENDFFGQLLDEMY